MFLYSPLPVDFVLKLEEGPLVFPYGALMYSTCKSKSKLQLTFFLQSLLPKSSSLFFVHVWSLSICALIESTRAFTFEFELRLTLDLWRSYWVHSFICSTFIINSSHIASSSDKIESPTLWSFRDLQLSKISPLKSDRQLSGPSMQRTPLSKIPFLSTLSPPVHRSFPPVPEIFHPWSNIANILNLLLLFQELSQFVPSLLLISLALVQTCLKVYF